MLRGFPLKVRGLGINENRSAEQFLLSDYFIKTNAFSDMSENTLTWRVQEPSQGFTSTWIVLRGWFVEPSTKYMILFSVFFHTLSKHLRKTSIAIFNLNTKHCQILPLLLYTIKRFCQTPLLESNALMVLRAILRSSIKERFLM